MALCGAKGGGVKKRMQEGENIRRQEHQRAPEVIQGRPLVEGVSPVTMVKVCVMLVVPCDAEPDRAEGHAGHPQEELAGQMCDGLDAVGPAAAHEEDDELDGLPDDSTLR